MSRDRIVGSNRILHVLISQGSACGETVIVQTMADSDSSSHLLRLSPRIRTYEAAGFTIAPTSHSPSS